MHLNISSSDFENNAFIPKSCSCQGQDKPPRLHWENAPSQTRSFALIVDDPDAPNGTWTHWVLFNIPAHVHAIGPDASQPKGSVSAQNSWGIPGYRGPCPPSGTHRYFFKLYALDTELKLDPMAKRETVLEAMKDHILAASQIMGMYSK